MAISLKKGQKVDLTKTNPGLKEVLIGLGWDTNKYDGGKDFDLDSSVFLLGANNKVASDDDFVFYGNLKHKSGAVEHMGDNLTGAGEGDDEQIKIDLSKVPAEVEKIDFTVTIYEAEERKQNFGQVENAFIRVVNSATNATISAKIFLSRRLLLSANSIATRASGSLTLSAPASAAGSPRSAKTTASMCD